MADPITKTIGIARDARGWDERLRESAHHQGVAAELFDIGTSDWLERVQQFSCVVWSPNLDDPWLEHAREKLHFMEHVLGLRVFPNWRTFWMYDNKKAQAYFLDYHRIPTPRTFVSYSLDESLAFCNQAKFPLVSKTSGGASSCGVKLIRTKARARRQAMRAFRTTLATRALRRAGYSGLRARSSPQGYVLWQEFLDDNPGDWRFVIIGQTAGFVFFRRNREHDFRASGSHREHWGERKDEALLYLMTVCARHAFDYMAFDILYRQEQCCISEMSYTHPAAGLDEAPGYFRLHDGNQLRYEEGPVSAQDLYMQYIASCLEGT